MDKIYKFYDRRASPNIHLDDYFRRYGEALESWNRREKTASTEEDVFRLMDVDVSRARTRLMPYYCRCEKLRFSVSFSLRPPFESSSSQCVPSSIDNLALPMETADSKKREHCRLVDIPERIVRDTSLETIRALKELPEDAFSKPKSHNNGVSIVGNRFCETVRPIGFARLHAFAIFFPPFFLTEVRGVGILGQGGYRDTKPRLFGLR